jgi:hypothetical protein
MLELLLLGFPLIPVTNWVMSLIKRMASEHTTTGTLRAVLFFVSFLGLGAASILTGEPFDYAKVLDLSKHLGGTALLALASHYSYRVIKEA